MCPTHIGTEGQDGGRLCLAIALGPDRSTLLNGVCDR